MCWGIGAGAQECIDSPLCHHTDYRPVLQYVQERCQSIILENSQNICKSDILALALVCEGKVGRNMRQIRLLLNLKWFLCGLMQYREVHQYSFKWVLTSVGSFSLILEIILSICLRSVFKQLI